MGNKQVKPWEIRSSKKPSDAFTIPLWAAFKPSDFYFASSLSEDVVIIYIVPAEHWDRSCKTFHDSMPIVQHLPNYLQEIFEGAYEADEGLTTQDVCRDLLRRGFTHNHFFQRYIDQYNVAGARF